MFPLIEDTVKSSTLKIGRRKFEAGKDYMVAARNNSSKKIKTRRVIFAGYGINDSLYSDYKGLDVKGAVVVLALGEPKENGNNIIRGTGRYTWSSINRKVAEATERGADNKNANKIFCIIGFTINVVPCFNYAIETMPGSTIPATTPGLHKCYADYFT